METKFEDFMREFIIRTVEITLEKTQRNSAQKNETESTTIPEEILNRDQVCNLLNITKSTLWSWTKSNKLKVYGIGVKRYYKRSEVLAALEPKTN